MAWTKAKMAIVVGITAIALTLGAGYFSFFHKTHPNQPGKRKLPVGEVTPVISFGRTHGVILASDGSLWAWGENDLGWPALGLDNIKNTAFLNRIGNENDWVSIAVGESHNLAIKADGTVWAWGENIRYELGDGTRTARSTPVRSVALNDWKQAASGLEDSFLIKNDGTLWAWGLNNFGQLGSGDFKASPVPVQIGSAIWKKVWAGFINAAGLQSDGSLWVWGGGPSVGNTTTSPKSGKSGKHYSLPNRISHDTNWVDVAVSVNVVFTIKSEGTLWAWGYDAPRYTGDANNTDTLIQVGAEHDWQTCSCCGSRYLVLIKKDGSLWSLSSPDLQDKAKLKRIDLQKNIVAIGGGGGLGAALTRDGEVWTWGKVIGEQVATIRGVGKNAELVQPTFTVLDKPWQLSNLDKTA